ncbi:hypothetical protein AB0F72_33475 [Actinoplanes sp. NPDC023936]|uniref:hypothetical protein n=1 Tax=Actinoplanes sp. NPDC023936 TaxID=3154910 RepID=UPI0033CF6713
MIIGINWVWAALLPLFTLAPGPVGLGVVGALCAFVGPMWNVVIFSYATLLVPNDLLGRVMSAGATLTWGVMPVASLGAGLMLTVLSPVAATWTLAAVMLGAALAATLSPVIRSAPPIPAVPAVPRTSTFGHG